MSYRLRICSPVPGVTVQPDSTRKEYYESIKSTWAAEKGRSDAAKSARSAFIENLSSVENGIDQVQLDVVSSGDSRLLTAEVIEDTIAKLQQELEVANNRHEQFLKNREGLVQELEEVLMIPFPIWYRSLSFSSFRCAFFLDSSFFLHMLYDNGRFFFFLFAS